MKKVISFIYIIVSFLLLTSCKVYDGDLSEYINLRYDHNIKYYDDFNNLLESTKVGTDYIYFGKPNCPWCQEYLPYYNDFAEKNNKMIHYYNADYVKGTYETVDEEGNITLNVNEKYQEIVDWIYQFDKSLTKNYININMNLKDSKGNPQPKLWLFVPRLFKVVNGKIEGMVGTIDGHDIQLNKFGDPYLPEMSEEQKDLLFNQLEELFRD